MNLTSKRKAVIDAYDKGYRIIGNNVDYKGKIRKLDIKYKKDNGISQYATFGVRDFDGKRVQIQVQHLAAYQKYKNFFINEMNINDEKMVVMHKDGNTLNNTLENIYLGTRNEVAENRLKKQYENSQRNRTTTNGR
jgi:hypothetical protein